VQIDQQPFNPVISGDGRFVAFVTSASNVVPGDPGRDNDVFVHDRATRTTFAASVNSSGALAIYEGGVGSHAPALSGDGRFIAFDSAAVNFDASDRQGIFVHDRLTGETTRVSVSSAGVPGDGATNPAISADGRFVAFTSIAANLAPGDTNREADVFVRDRATGATTRVSFGNGGAEGNGGSGDPAISSDGRFVAFDSLASNLVPGDTNSQSDVFLRDRAAGTTTRLSSDRDGGYAPSISANGRFVAFRAFIPRPWNPVLLYDRATGKTNTMAPDGGGTLSADGRFVAFATAWPIDPSDTNGKSDVYVHDTTVVVSEPVYRKLVRLTVVVKKKRGRFLVSGVLRPRRPRRMLTVTLARARNGRYADIRAKRVRLTAASTYSTAFRRPRSFFCRVRATFAGDSKYAPATSGKKFRC
jgi:Tol biopolymer transport system component